jgi:hypothetical protein
MTRIVIKASEQFLTYEGDAHTALYLVDSIRDAYSDMDLPRMLNHFIFNIEMALQEAGLLDELFNRIEPEGESK